MFETAEAEHMKAKMALQAAISDMDANSAIAIAQESDAALSPVVRGLPSSPGAVRPPTRGGSSRPPTRSAIAAEAHVSVQRAESDTEATRRELRRVREQFDEQELQLQDLRRSETSLRAHLESEAPLRAALEREL